MAIHAGLGLHVPVRKVREAFRMAIGAQHLAVIGIFELRHVDSGALRNVLLAIQSMLAFADMARKAPHAFHEIGLTGSLGLIAWHKRSSNQQQRKSGEPQNATR
ncbi:hypothetical protein [Hyphomicrobium sulfonivorans]|uniref:hypothetical protein n=1 Tax=Hyphomicrobium sulfonivorans TaxID=121290 RepID=UPI0018E10B4F|nr:hypothetical protein [Hyphomicrobium sulfonivorans]